MPERLDEKLGEERLRRGESGGIDGRVFCGLGHDAGHLVQQLGPPFTAVSDEIAGGVVQLIKDVLLTRLSHPFTEGLGVAGGDGSDVDGEDLDESTRAGRRDTSMYREPLHVQGLGQARDRIEVELSQERDDELSESILVGVISLGPKPVPELVPVGIVFQPDRRHAHHRHERGGGEVVGDLLDRGAPSAGQTVPVSVHVKEHVEFEPGQIRIDSQGGIGQPSAKSVLPRIDVIV